MVAWFVHVAAGSFWKRRTFLTFPDSSRAAWKIFALLCVWSIPFGEPFRREKTVLLPHHFPPTFLPFCQCCNHRQTVSSS